MRRLAEFFLVNNKLTAMLSLFIFIAGLLGMMMLNAESYPSVNFATAIVETNYRGAAPEDIESKITKPIEDKIRTVSGLKDVRSTSQSGKSRIVVRVDIDHEDVEAVMTDLEKAVNQVSELPTDLLEDPSFTEMKSEEFPAIEIAIVGPNPNRSRDKLADQLKEDLEDSKRVKNVILSGFQKREFNILLNREKLDRYHIGVSEVLSKLSARNVDVPGGDLVKEGSQQLVRIQAKVRSAEDLRQMLIRSNFSGKGVLLGDVAEVVDGSEEPRFLSRYNGKEATVLIVNKKGGADTIQLVHEVESIINRAKAENEGKFEIVVVNNEAEKVKNRLGILSSNAVSGLVLVIVFLLLFLPGRIGVMASLSLPLAVLATFGLMPFFGMNLDAITILALVIALGMLVDNSVVISENFTRLKKEGHTSLDAAVTSVEQLALPITATALTTIGAFLPMLVTRGIMGEFIKFIPIVVTIALVISLIESFFLLPLRLKWAGDRVNFSKDESSRDWFDGFTDRFEGLMAKLVRHRYWVGLGFTGLLVGSFLMLGVANRFELFPAEQTEIYLARFEAPTGTTLEKTAELGSVLTKKVEEVLGDNIRGVVSKIGSSQQHPTDPRGKEGDNLGILIMYASQYAKYNIDYRVIVEKLRQIKMPEFTSLEFEEQVNGPPVGAAINATFRSNNLNHLNTVVENLKGELAKLPGVYDLKIDDVIGDDEVFVHVDYRLADQLGLSVSDVGNTIRTALSGTIVSDVVLDNKEVNLNVKIANLDRETIDDLNDLKVMDRRGNLVPLGRIAKFEKRPGTPQIKRFDYKRARTLTGSVETQKVTSIEANALLQNKFSELRQQYPDVSLVFGGQQESTNESMESLAAAMALALLAIFCLMVFVFNSYLSPLIIMSTIPLGLVGFSVAFYFHGRPVSFLAMIGMVGLAGIIVNSGIVLISFIEQMRAEGKMTLEEILVKSSGVRLRAVVVTSLTTVSGLFPTAYGIGGSDSMLVPMTLAMAWGLTSGTLLTLLWIPCAYAILEDFKEWTARLFQKKAVAAEAPVLAAGGAHAHREEEERPREIFGMSEELGITEQSSDTKKRILDSALKIFAEHGFDGASIRSISQEAKVNIAAINYHFGNKENLYFEVVRYSYTQMNVKIQELNAVRELSLEELAVGIFDLLQTKSSMLVNTFRMLLSGRHVFDRLCEVGCEGPPGGDYIAAAIRRKIPKITDADLFWAVRSLFSLIIHQSLILCIAPDNKMKMKATAVEVRDGIGRVAQLVLADLSKKYSV